MKFITIMNSCFKTSAFFAGDTSIENFASLNDDWNVEERCLSALACWDLDYLLFSRPVHSLSGEEKTKVFLFGIVL